MISRFFTGMRFFGRGWSVAFGRGELVPFVLLPGLLAIALTLGGAVWTRHAASAFVARHTAGHGALVGVLVWIAVQAFVLATGYVFYVVSCLVATAPFAGALSVRAEAFASGAPVAKEGFGAALSASLRGAGHTLLGAILYLGLSLPLFVLQWIALPLAPLFWLAGLVLSALFFAFDGFNEPLHRRAAGFGAKWRFVLAHGAESLGFGTAVALLMAIPLVNLIVTPVSVVGGTLLYVELTRQK
jgi:uncharacterized protein involved in cysteine biosynthesis